MEEAFRLIKNDPLNDSKKSLAIIYTDDIKDKYLDKISELIYIDKNPNLVCLTKDIIEAKKYSNKILFLQKGSISADDLLKLSNRLDNQGIYLEGILLLEDDKIIDFDFILFILKKYNFNKLKI